MASVPNWTDGELEAEAWDKCWLWPLELPGPVSIKVRSARDIDVHKCAEVDGARQVNKGVTPATVDITLTIPEDDGGFAWREWMEQLPQIEPHKPGAYQRPWKIINAEPNSRGITQVVVLEIESETPKSGEPKKYKIKCQQWFPKVAKAKSKKAVTNKEGGWLLQKDAKGKVALAPDFSVNSKAKQ